MGDPRRVSSVCYDLLAMEERRRASRTPVQDVRGVLILSIEARIVNVSLTGAALELSSPIRVGRTYSLTVASRSRVLRLQGRVVWCQPVDPQRDAAGESVSTYHAGLRFDGILDPKGEKLLEMFREGVVLSFGQRLCARFRLATPRPVNLDAEHELEVRKLSRTGMLIETELAAELEFRVRAGDPARRKPVAHPRPHRLPDRPLRRQRRPAARPPLSARSGVPGVVRARPPDPRPVPRRARLTAASLGGVRSGLQDSPTEGRGRPSPP